MFSFKPHQFLHRKSRSHFPISIKCLEPLPYVGASIFVGLVRRVAGSRGVELENSRIGLFPSSKNNKWFKMFPLTLLSGFFFLKILCLCVCALLRLEIWIFETIPNLPRTSPIPRRPSFRHRFLVLVRGPCVKFLEPIPATTVVTSFHPWLLVPVTFIHVSIRSFEFSVSVGSAIWHVVTWLSATGSWALCCNWGRSLYTLNHILQPIALVKVLLTNPCNDKNIIHSARKISFFVMWCFTKCVAANWETISYLQTCQVPLWKYPS